MRILHLPDFCFGMADSEEEEMTEESCCFDILFHGLEVITKKYPVDYIFITSNIAKDVFLENRREIAYYLNKITAVCGEGLRRIYLCPGMYDMGCAKERNCCLFYIYEIEETGKRETCISTTYQFDGKGWNKHSERIYFRAEDEAEKKRRPSPRFSVMWWMKIS